MTTYLLRNDMKKKWMFHALLMTALTVCAPAGQIDLVNGDRLTGEIAGMEGGKVVIQTELLGEVRVPVDNIRTLSSTQPLELHLKDGSVLNQAVEQAEPGTIRLPGRADGVALSEVAKINPEKPRWTGDLSTGITFTSGNTRNESYSFSGQLGKRTDTNRTTLGGDAMRRKERNDDGDDVVTENWWRAMGQFDHFISKKSYLFTQARYETDDIADLDRRLILGGGYGYQWIETDRTEFSTEVGLSWIDEKYEQPDQDDSRLAAQAGYRFRHKFDDTFSFIHDLTYYPSTEQFSDYYLTASSELRAAINKHLFTNFRVLFDYDASPATGKSSTDIKYLFGAGINF